MSASDYRAWARRALSGKWPMAVLVGLVASILGGSGEVNFSYRLEEKIETISEVSPELAGIRLGILGTVSVITVLYAMAMVVVGSVIQLGYVRYNLKLVDGREAYLGDLFTYFDRFGDAFLLRLYMGIFIVLWSMLFVIPGIVAAYGYAMAPYIMAEDPQCRPLDALRRSKEMMNGRKMDLFLLQFSFIGWNLLSVLTFGLAQLFVTPYTNAATAAFYRDLQTRPQPRYYVPNPEE